MKFAYAGFLILLLCLPAMVYYLQLILKLALKRRERAFSGRNYEALVNYRSQPNFTIKVTLYLAAVALTAFAAARPQGLEKPEEVEASSIDVCFAIDVSESMKALDLGRDSRLEVTKAVVSHLIDNLKSDRVAIVAFAGEASCICPLTLDHASAKSLLLQADYDLLDRGGTRLDIAIQTAAARFSKDDEAAKVIVIFTDGEDHEGKPEDAAREAYKNGIVIHSVGIGSKNGVKIPVSRDIWGAPIYKKYKGKDVITRLNEQVLMDIAAAAGGSYFHVADQNGLVKMINGLKSIKKRALRVSSISVREELFGYFAFLALILFIADSFVPARSLKKNSPGIKTAVLAFAAPLMLLCPGPQPAFAAHTVPPVKSEYGPLSEKISEYCKKGNALYEAGDFAAAEYEFHNARILSPSDTAGSYNIGCARYKNRDYRGAVEAFRAAAAFDRQETRFEPYYNMGNSYFKLSDYKNAIASYEKALKIKPGDEDTLHNLELARKKLEEEMKKNAADQKQAGEKNGGGNEKGGEENKKEKESAGGDNKENNAGDKDGMNQRQASPDGNERRAENEGAAGENGENKEGSGDKSAARQGTAGEGEVKDLVDRQNIEKYKNIQIDPNRLKMFLKDLENDETRVQYLYQRNKKRMRAKDDDDTDIFNLSPEEIHERMMRQMLPESDRPREVKKNAAGDKKDW